MHGGAAVSAAGVHNPPMRPLPLLFTGSPDALRLHTRRDTLVNIVLGGLYTPVVRRHTTEYLATHTTVDGTPLASVNVPSSRWPAILLVLTFIALRVANEFDLGPPMPLMILYGVLLVPYLWTKVTLRSVESMRWRQIQPWFRPPWKDVYLQSWPLLLLGAAWAVAQPRVAAMAPKPGTFDVRWIAASAAAAVVALPLLARQAFNYRRLRLAHTLVGGSSITWDAPFASFLRLWLVTAAAILLTAVAPVLLLRQALFGSLTNLPETRAGLVYVGAIVLAVVLSVPARAWYEARSFVLTWDGLRMEDRMRVECTLDVRAFVARRTFDAWRSIATLGLHRPRSVVNAYQAKLSSLTVWSA